MSNEASRGGMDKEPSSDESPGAHDWPRGIEETSVWPVTSAFVLAFCTLVRPLCAELRHGEPYPTVAWVGGLLLRSGCLPTRTLREVVSRIHLPTLGTRVRPTRPINAPSGDGSVSHDRDRNLQRGFVYYYSKYSYRPPIP